MHVLYPRLSNTGVHNIFLCEKLPNVLILFHAVLTIVILKFEWLYQKERKGKQKMHDSEILRDFKECL